MAYTQKWYLTEAEKEYRDDMGARLRKAAILVRNSARSKAPVGDKPHKENRYPVYGKILKPGTLKKSITYRVDKKKLKARIGTSYVYGIFQELGPVTGKTDYYRSPKRIALNRKWRFKPFLRPAFHEKEREIKSILGIFGDILVGGDKMRLKPSDILLGGGGYD